MNSLKRLVVSLEPLYPLSNSKAGDSESKESNESETKEPEPMKSKESSESFEHNEPNDYAEFKGSNHTSPANALKPSAISEKNPELSLGATATAFFHRWCYMIFVRPLLLIWLLVTFPFTYFFGADYPLLDSPRAGTPDAAETPDSRPLDEKTALLKEEKMMANHIKSPTGSKYIIPPPPRLFPLRRNPDRRRRKKTLILDLDETLIHSLSRAAPRSLGASGPYHMIELKINNMATLYYVYKRPFCDFFLREAAKWFDLQIFTASVQEYADPIIDWLEADMVDHKSADSPKVFTKRYYRHDCTFRPGVGYIKDLSSLFPKEEDLKNVIILDNSPVSYALHEDNAVMIEGWINDQGDRDLLNLLPMLYSLSLCIDVRFVLGLRSGEKSFER